MSRTAAEYTARRRRATAVTSILAGGILLFGLAVPLAPESGLSDRSDLVPCGPPIAKLFVDRSQLNPYQDSCDTPLAYRITATVFIALMIGLVGGFYAHGIRKREIQAELVPHPEDVPALPDGALPPGASHMMGARPMQTVSSDSGTHRSA